MKTRDVVITGCCRTASGRFLGGLSSLTAPDLGGVVIKEAVRRSGIAPHLVDEVFMGNVVQAGVGQAPARQAALKGGVPSSVAATTVNKVCGSGLKAIMFGTQAIKLEEADCVVAGGMESMSQCPYIMKNLREGVKSGDQKMLDSLIHDGLWCAFENVHMGVLAEYTAQKAGLKREQLDEYAYHSQQKAVKAMKDGKFKDEIVPVEIPQKKGNPLIIDTDETPRPETTLEGLAKLRPAFQKDGMVTAGNSPGLNDGASAVVVMAEDTAKKHGVKPLARITGYSSGFGDPKEIFFAPIIAVNKLIKQLGVDIGHFDLIEANEAFAAQCLADGLGLGWDWDRVNVHGGAIALGHPIGASGARVVTTLISALQDRGLKTGLATLCLGGGGAVAMSLERIE